MSMKITGGSAALSTAIKLDRPTEKDSVSRDMDQLLAMISQSFGSDAFTAASTVLPASSPHRRPQRFTR